MNMSLTAELEYFCRFNNIDASFLYELFRKNAVDVNDILFVEKYLNMRTNDSVNNDSIIEKLNKDIKKSSDLYSKKYMLLFHGTSKFLMDNIEKEGLLPTSANRRRSFQSTDGYVYLANGFDKAAFFGSLGNCDDYVVYMVLVWVRNIKMDVDQLNNQRIAYPMLNIKNTVGHSIFYGGTVRVKGNIPAYQLIPVYHN